MQAILTPLQVALAPLQVALAPLQVALAPLQVALTSLQVTKTIHFPSHCEPHLITAATIANNSLKSMEYSIADSSHMSVSNIYH